LDSGKRWKKRGVLDLSHAVLLAIPYILNANLRKGAVVMELRSDIGNRQIIDAIKDYPEIGAILYKYEIGCIKCGVGTCLLKDVVSIHFLGEETETRIEKEINTYLENV
jgi:hypothetical protein